MDLSNPGSDPTLGSVVQEDSNQGHLSTEAWLLDLKSKSLEVIFLFPEPRFSEILEIAQDIAANTLFADLKTLVQYSFKDGAIPIQKRTQSVFMRHVLRLMRAFPNSKSLNLLKELLAQPKSYFNQFFGGYPKDLLEAVLVSLLQVSPEAGLQIIKQKGLGLDAKLAALGAYMDWVQGEGGSVKSWQTIEKTLAFLEQNQQDKQLVPQGLFDGLVGLFIRYKVEQFEVIIRRWYMFGLVDEQKAGDLETVVAQLNATYTL